MHLIKDITAYQPRQSLNMLPVEEIKASKWTIVVVMKRRMLPGIRMIRMTAATRSGRKKPMNLAWLTCRVMCGSGVPIGMECTIIRIALLITRKGRPMDKKKYLGVGDGLVLTKDVW